MEGHDYEYVVAAYLRNKGYHGVKVTKASGDYGVDVIAHMGSKKYAVQCKYYSKPVSLGAVQEAVAGKAMYGCNAAMVVTNNTFTKAAEELAARNGVVLIPKVNSTGFTFGGFFKRIITIGIVLIALLLLFCTVLVADTIISEFKNGLYKQALLNLLDLILLWCVFIGVPIGLKFLFKYLKNTAKAKLEEWKSRKAADKAKPVEQAKVYQAERSSITDTVNLEKQTLISQSNDKSSAVNIPEGFAKYQNLTSSKVEEYSFKPTRKSREEMIQELSKLRNDDFDAYSRLYEILRPVFASGRNSVSIGHLQRNMKIGFNRAARIMDSLENSGLVVPSWDYRPGSLVVTEQELIDLLTEVENNPIPIESAYDKISSALKELKSNDSEEYTRLCETVKVFLPEGHISSSAVHIRMGYDYFQSNRLIDTIKGCGIVLQRSLCDYEFVITEQEFEELYEKIGTSDLPINAACTSDTLKPSNDMWVLDSLSYDAMKFFFRKGRVSIGLIQRELKISFNRAARIVDCLEELGCITPVNGTREREILVTEQEFEELYKEIENNPT